MRTPSVLTKPSSLHTHTSHNLITTPVLTVPVAGPCHLHPGTWSCIWLMRLALPGCCCDPDLGAYDSTCTAWIKAGGWVCVAASAACRASAFFLRCRSAARSACAAAALRSASSRAVRSCAWPRSYQISHTTCGRSATCVTAASYKNPIAMLLYKFCQPPLITVSCPGLLATSGRITTWQVILTSRTRISAAASCWAVAWWRCRSSAVAPEAVESNGQSSALLSSTMLADV